MQKIDLAQKGGLQELSKLIHSSISAEVSTPMVDQDVAMSG